jgi:hypothetical protein
MDTLPRAFAGACKIIGLVQEPHGSLSSPTEFAAHGGKFSFSGAVGAETEVSRTTLLPAHAQGIAAEILFCRKAAKKIGAESPTPPQAGVRPNSFLKS